MNEPGGELVLLRPRRAHPTPADPVTKSDRPYDYYDENLPYDLVPVDQFDFTGLQIHGLVGAQVDVHAWHYIRVNAGTGNDRWRCVYSGRYFADKGNAGIDPEEPRHEGTKDHKFTVPPDTSQGQTLDDKVPGAPVNLGGDDSSSNFSFDTSKFPPIQLGNDDFAGPSPLRQ